MKTDFDRDWPVREHRPPRILSGRVPHPVQIHVRLNAPLVRRLDAFAAESEINRSDAVALLLTRVLDAIDRKAGHA